MIFIRLYDILNSIDNRLEGSIKNYDSSFVDNFIEELKQKLCNEKESSESKENDMFVLDRIEGNNAICENMHNGELIDIDKNLIDKNAKEGDVLIFKNDMYLINKEENLKRREEINNLIDNLWKE